MIKQALAVGSILVFAFLILFVSILRTAAVTPSFSYQPVQGANTEVNNETDINYHLAYPGSVLPNSPAWPLKAARDRVWLTLTTSPTKKAELNLLFADKRLGAGRELFNRGEYELGYSTILKAEKYLEKACDLEEKNRQQGYNTDEFLEKITRASLKHIQVIRNLREVAPEDASPMLDTLEANSTEVFERKSQAMVLRGLTPPNSPFK